MGEVLLPCLAFQCLGLLSGLGLNFLLVLARHKVKVHNGIFEDFDHGS